MKKKKLSNLKLNKVKIADLNILENISGGGSRFPCDDKATEACGSNWATCVSVEACV